MHQDVKYDFTANLTTDSGQVGRKIVFHILMHLKVIERCFEQTDIININNRVRQAIPNVNYASTERMFS